MAFTMKSPGFVVRIDQVNLVNKSLQGRLTTRKVVGKGFLFLTSLNLRSPKQIPFKCFFLWHTIEAGSHKGELEFEVQIPDEFRNKLGTFEDIIESIFENHHSDLVYNLKRRFTGQVGDHQVRGVYAPSLVSNTSRVVDDLWADLI
jgi:hypothetical protein